MMPWPAARSNRRICGGLRFCSTPTRSGKRGGPEQRAIAGPRAFNGLCDDEAMPLICPDVSSIGPTRPCRRLPATLHGVVFDIFGWEPWLFGGEISGLKPHTPSSPHAPDASWALLTRVRRDDVRRGMFQRHALNAMKIAMPAIMIISTIRNLSGLTRLAKRAPISVPIQRPAIRLTIVSHGSSVPCCT